MIASILQSHSWLDFVLLFIAAVLMPFLAVVSGRSMARRPPKAGQFVPLYWQTIAFGWVIAAVIAGIWYATGRPFSVLGLAPPFRMWDFAGFALVGLVALFAFARLYGRKTLSAERLARALKRFDGVKLAPTTRGEVAVFMLVSITAGVWEELLYRGFLIWFLLPLAGPWGAIVLSALIFGVGHIYQDARGIFFTVLVGLVFAAGFVVTHSLSWLIAAHALIDIHAGIDSYKVRQFAARQSATEPS